jgi:lipopolysaccharide export LptBFGC system permease protein LptF
LSVVLLVAFGPWLLADALFVHSGQSEHHWASSSGFLQGSFFWAVLVLALGTAAFAFGRLINRGSTIAVVGTGAAFITGGIVFGYIWLVAVFFLHTVVLGGSI